MINLGYAVTGSFCTHKESLDVLRTLVKNYNIIPIVSDNVYKTNTRFGKAQDFLKALKEITKNDPVFSLSQAEPLGPKNLIDMLVIAPCTGNTLAKLANAITDNAVTMTAKAIMRNNRPIVIAVSTNDGLGLSLQNIATLINTKNIFFVPMCQDNPENKPKSLVSDWSKVEETIKFAYEYKQIQPIFCLKNC